MIKKLYIKALVFINLFLYFIFLTLDMIGGDMKINLSSKIKYISIVLCFLLTLGIGKDGYDKIDRLLLQTALFFTAIADFFFVILNWYEPGILSFIFVQITYLIRHRKSWRPSKTYIFIWIFSAIFLLFYLFKFNNYSISLYVLGIIYAVLLILSLSVVFSPSSKKYYPKTGTIVIVLGMILFLLCDLNVALFYMTNNYNIKIFSNIPFGFLIWFFYLPSQLFLGLSGYKASYLKTLFR